MEGVFLTMGFPMDRVRIAIAECGDDQDAIIQYLLDHAREPAPGAPPTSDNAILVGELISMGFTRERVLKAIEACGPKVEECTQWLIDGAPAEPHEAAADVGSGSGSAVEMELRNMGFQADRVHQAVRQKGEDLEAALQWLVAEQETADDAPPPPSKVRKVSPSLAAKAAAGGAVRGAARAESGAGGAGAGAGAGAAAVPPPGMRRPDLGHPGGSAPSIAAAAASTTTTTTAMAPSRQLHAAGDSRALKRLMKELTQLTALDRQPGGCRALHAFECEPVDESDLFLWELRLYDFSAEDPIAVDLRRRRLEHMTLRMHFPPEYPNAPPFVYMVRPTYGRRALPCMQVIRTAPFLPSPQVRPRLKEHTGYVLSGGGICMELLTPSGWSPATSIDALVHSVRAMLMAGNARLHSTEQSTKESDYTYEGARRDFEHILAVHGKHGWTSHPMFRNA